MKYDIEVYLPSIMDLLYQIQSKILNLFTNEKHEF